MEKSINIDNGLLVIDPKDNVGTALQSLRPGDKVRHQFLKDQHEIVVLDAISFGHKVAVQSIEVGENIVKYGEMIGRATINIQAGQHVHVHNVEGVRGRGDLIHLQKGVSK